MNDLKTKSFLLTLMVALFLCSTALAQSGDPAAPEPLVLTDEQGEYPLGLHLEILEDPSGVLTIEDVSSPDFDSQFVPSQVESPNYGFSASAYWVRLRLDNETRRTVDWLLEVDFANTHFVDLYAPLPDGEGFDVRQTGILRPVSTRDVLDPNIVFNLFVPTLSQQTTYLRFQNGASMTLPLTLWTQDAFQRDTARDHLLHGLFYGVLVCLLIYNLFLLFSLRESSYLYFVIALAAMIFFFSSYDGYMEVYVLPNLYSLIQYYIALSWAMLFVSIVLFTDTFLQIKTQLPKLHRANIALLGIWGVLILLTPFTSYHLIAALMIPWALVSLIMVLGAGMASIQRGFHPARLYLIAWSGLCVTLIIVILARVGAIPVTLLSENLFRLGGIWLGVCWSFALADRINLLKAETESANRDLHKSERRLSQILDGLPLGVVLYGKDQKPKYANQRTIELFSNPVQGVRPDLTLGRTLAQAIPYFSLRTAGDHQEYPLEQFPVYYALQGVPASADDIEMDRGDERVTLEIQASPVRDDAGNVESAVVAIQDITQRKQVEAELVGYRKQLEALVNTRTEELSEVNEQLHLRLEWLSAVNQVNQTMARSADFAEIHASILEIINRLFATQGSFIAELDAGSRRVKILAHSCCSELHLDLVGSFTTLPESILSDSNPGPGKVAFLSGDRLSALSGPTGGPFGLHIQFTKIQGIAFVPLQLRDQILGFLGLELSETGRMITNEESNLLGIFSVDIAQLIEDGRLFEQTKSLIMAEERNRLARDLHDSVTQVLFSATLLAEVLPQIWRRDPELGMQKLDKLRQLTRGALAEMRTMLLELRPSAVINTPLSGLLVQLAAAATSRSGLLFQLSIEHIPPLPENVHINFYRIAQEALNNVVKHAQADQVTMSLSATPLTPGSTGAARHEVNLVIQDDGVGYSAEQRESEHMGIGIMRDRAAAIQGSLSLESRPGYGTQVTLIWSGETGSLA